MEFSERFIGPIPNVIIFQYNPETMTRTLEVWQPPEQTAEGGAAAANPAAASPTAQPNDPPEKFSVALELDAADALEHPESHPVAVIAGVADRIAALEMLLYPQANSALGGLLGSVGGALGGAVGGALSGLGGALGGAPVPRSSRPIVLFVWGPDRIVPVCLTSFSVEEQAYSPTLSPIRAKVNVEMKIVTPSEIDRTEAGAFSKEIAKAAFDYTKKRKQALATSNIANNIESILGMLPF